MNRNKLVLKREQISSLDDNHLSQVKGGTIITSVWGCMGFSWCNNGCPSNSCPTGGGGTTSGALSDAEPQTYADCENDADGTCH